VKQHHAPAQTVLTCQQQHELHTSYASVNSSIAHPPPRAFALVFARGPGIGYLQSCPGGGELFTGRAFDSTGRFCDEHVLLY
jgi:hypothetical protein